MLLKTSVRALLVACLLVDVHSPPPAEACGVKLTVKPSAPRRSVARSSNPSPVLLVGSPPRRLQNDLTQAGHKVEVTQDPKDAKRERYAVVIADRSTAGAARERFGDSVIVRSGDVRNDIVAVEDRVARRPVAVAAARPAVAAKPDREPIAAGPDRTAPKEPVAAAEPAPPPPAPTPPPPAPTPAPTPEPDRPAVTPTVATTQPSRPERPRKTAVDQAELREEVFFSVASARVREGRAVTRAIRWLTNNAGVNVTVTGHADPTGTPEGNMALSQTRAEAVRDFLVEKGIDASRIEVKALGDTQLKYGRRDGRNRRVAIEAQK